MPEYRYILKKPEDVRPGDDRLDEGQWGISEDKLRDILSRTEGGKKYKHTDSAFKTALRQRKLNIVEIKSGSKPAQHSSSSKLTGGGGGSGGGHPTASNNAQTETEAATSDQVILMSMKKDLDAGKGGAAGPSEAPTVETHAEKPSEKEFPEATYIKRKLDDPYDKQPYKWPRHKNAAAAEERLALAIHRGPPPDIIPPGEVVIAWGDIIGTHGPDIISVNKETGAVTLWDAKYRSNRVTVGKSGTFTKKTRLKKAIKQAKEIIMKNKTLPQNIKDTANTNLNNLSTFQTRTVPMGNALNSQLP
jgi:hypothetical protein